MPPSMSDPSAPADRRREQRRRRGKTDASSASAVATAPLQPRVQILSRSVHTSLDGASTNASAPPVDTHATTLKRTAKESKKTAPMSAGTETLRIISRKDVRIVSRPLQSTITRTTDRSHTAQQEMRVKIDAREFLATVQHSLCPRPKGFVPLLLATSCAPQRHQGDARLDQLCVAENVKQFFADRTSASDYLVVGILGRKSARKSAFVDALVCITSADATITSDYLTPQLQVLITMYVDANRVVWLDLSFDSQLRVDSPQAFAAIQFMMCVCNVIVIVADEEGTSAIDRKLLNAIATAKRRAAHIATGFAVQTPLHMVFAIHSHIFNRETWSAMHDLLRDTENMAPPVRGCHATRDASVEKYGQPLTTAHLNVMPTMFPMWRASSGASIYDVILLPRTTTSSLSNIFDTPAVPLDHVVSCMRRALISYSRDTDMQRPFASEREWMRFASRVAVTISSTMADKTVPAVAHREKAESRTRCIDNE